VQGYEEEKRTDGLTEVTGELGMFGRRIKDNQREDRTRSSW